MIQFYKRFVASAALIVSFGADAAAYRVDPQNSSVQFLAVGKPGFLKIRGEGGKVTGTVTEYSDSYAGSLVVSLADFKTGISMRDEHMHSKYLESAKYPDAKLTLRQISLKGRDDQACTFSGTLELKGVAKEVQGECNVSGLASSTVSVKASMVVKLEDYPIGVPSHLGVTVADVVTVTVDLRAEKLP